MDQDESRASNASSHGSGFMTTLVAGFKGPAFKFRASAKQEKISTTIELLGQTRAPDRNEPTYEIVLGEEDSGLIFKEDKDGYTVVDKIPKPRTATPNLRGGWPSRGGASRSPPPPPPVAGLALARRGDVLVAVNGRLVWGDPPRRTAALLERLRAAMATRTLRLLRPGLVAGGGARQYGRELARAQRAGRDRWGFRRALDHLRKEEQAREKAEDRMKKRDDEWIAFLKKKGGVQNLKMPSGSGEEAEADGGPLLKSLVRRGVPQELRGPVWMAVSGAMDLKAQYVPNYYLTCLQLSIDLDDKVKDDIEKDIDRTFPEHAYFESPQGANALRRLLTAYAAHDPDISYCQSLNFLAGLLLLFCSEEDAFWLLHTMLHTLLPRDYYMKDLVGTHVDQHVLSDLVALKVPAVHRLAQGLQVQLNMVTVSWFLCLYVNTLPMETALRVWDVFFNEGEGANCKVLFRVAVALLKRGQQDLLEAEDHADLFQRLKSIGSDVFDPDELLSMCYINYDGGLKTKIALYSYLGWDTKLYFPGLTLGINKSETGEEKEEGLLSFFSRPRQSVEAAPLTEAALQNHGSATPTKGLPTGGGQSAPDSPDSGHTLGFGATPAKLFTAANSFRCYLECRGGGPSKNGIIEATDQRLRSRSLSLKDLYQQLMSPITSENADDISDFVFKIPQNFSESKYTSQKVRKMQVMHFQHHQSTQSGDGYSNNIIIYQIHLENSQGTRWVIWRTFAQFKKSFEFLQKKLPDFRNVGFEFPENDGFNRRQVVQNFNQYLTIVNNLGTVPVEFRIFIEPTEMDVQKQPENPSPEEDEYFFHTAPHKKLTRGTSRDQSFMSTATLPMTTPKKRTPRHPQSREPSRGREGSAASGEGAEGGGGGGGDGGGGDGGGGGGRREVRGVRLTTFDSEPADPVDDLDAALLHGDEEDPAAAAAASVPMREASPSPPRRPPRPAPVAAPRRGSGRGPGVTGAGSPPAVTGLVGPWEEQRRPGGAPRSEGAGGAGNGNGARAAAAGVGGSATPGGGEATAEAEAAARNAERRRRPPDEDPWAAAAAAAAASTPPRSRPPRPEDWGVPPGSSGTGPSESGSPRPRAPAPLRRDVAQHPPVVVRRKHKDMDGSRPAPFSNEIPDCKPFSNEIPDWRRKPAPPKLRAHGFARPHRGSDADNGSARPHRGSEDNTSSKGGGSEDEAGKNGAKETDGGGRLFAWQRREDRGLFQRAGDRLDTRGFYRKDIERLRAIYREKVNAQFEKQALARKQRDELERSKRERDRKELEQKMAEARKEAEKRQQSDQTKEEHRKHGKKSSLLDGLFGWPSSDNVTNDQPTDGANDGPIPTAGDVNINEDTKQGKTHQSQPEEITTLPGLLNLKKSNSRYRAISNVNTDIKAFVEHFEGIFFGRDKPEEEEDLARRALEGNGEEEDEDEADYRSVGHVATVVEPEEWGGGGGGLLARYFGQAGSSTAPSDRRMPRELYAGGGGQERGRDGRLHGLGELLKEEEEKGAAGGGGGGFWPLSGPQSPVLTPRGQHRRDPTDRLTLGSTALSTVASLPQRSRGGRPAKKK